MTAASIAPDRIDILDNELQEKLRPGLRTYTGDHPWIPADLYHKAVPKIREHCAATKQSIEGDLDSISVAESEWLHQNNSEPALAWVQNNHLIIKAPYAISLAKQLFGMGGVWSEYADAWVLPKPAEASPDLNAVFDAWDILASPSVLDVCEGRGSWKEHLEGLVEKAVEAGFVAPSGFKSGRKYKPHQEQSVLALAYRGATLLGDQVGLGKGGQFIGGVLCQNMLLEKRGEQPAYPCVLSVTKSMKAEIVEEIQQWKHDAKIHVVNGVSGGQIDPEADFIILNHDILSRRLDDILEVCPRAFIADEAHVFKNLTAKRTQAAIRIADAVRENTKHLSVKPYIVMATGTPMLSSPSELFAILSVLGLDDMFFEKAKENITDTTVSVRRYNPKTRKKTVRTVPLWPQRAFEMRWCDGNYDKYGAWHNNGASNIGELHEMLLETCMLRRRKSDIMHPLPKLHESVVYMEPSAAEYKEYRRIENEFRTWSVEQAKKVAAEEGISLQDAVKLIIRRMDSGGEAIMRMTACRAALAATKVEPTVKWIHEFMNNTPPSGEDDNLDRRKLIVFVHHKEPRKLLAEHPELQQYGVATILSGTEQKGASIQEHKKRFQEDPDTRLMICSMAAREGHTLTAAKDVLLMEVPFVPAWVVQMAGRCWARMSELYTPHEAYVHYGVVQGTEDSRSVKRVLVKKATFNAIIDGEGQDDTIEDISAENADMLLHVFALGNLELGVAS